MVKKRDDYISWNEYFMGIAKLSAQRSKDPSTQVGACIVGKDNKIISIGYNGLPIGYSDDEFDWTREHEKKEETKYPYICHAELNAILNAQGTDLKGSTIYVTLFPCNECAKLIVQSGIKKVIYISDKYADQDIFIASRRILETTKVEIEKYEPSNKIISIEI